MTTQMVAHRGGSGLRMENTPAAFIHAMETGAAGAELDVHLSRDGEVVVHHDDNLNPSYCRDQHGHWIDPNTPLALAQLTLEQMQTFDISAPRPDSDYAQSFPAIEVVPGQRIPSLGEVIECVKARSDTFFLVIEIKASPLQATSKSWKPLVDKTLSIIRQQAFSDRALMCSFDWGALCYARQQAPDLPVWMTTNPLSWFAPGTPPAHDIPPSSDILATLRQIYQQGNAPWFAGYDPRDYGQSYARAVAAAEGRAWFPHYSDLTEQSMREIKAAGLDSAAWSTNLSDRRELTRLVNLGVDYFVTDYPNISAASLLAR